jgi:hypothetical protein
MPQFIHWSLRVCPKWPSTMTRDVLVVLVQEAMGGAVAALNWLGATGSMKIVSSSFIGNSVFGNTSAPFTLAGGAVVAIGMPLVIERFRMFNNTAGGRFERTWTQYASGRHRVCSCQTLGS